MQDPAFQFLQLRGGESLGVHQGLFPLKIRRHFFKLGFADFHEITEDAVELDLQRGDAVGELEAAVEKYRRCVELDPEFFDGWHALGMALMKLGRYPDAIVAGMKATELRPNDQIAWTSLSLFYNRAGDIKQAEAAGTKAKILSWGGKIAKE